MRRVLLPLLALLLAGGATFGFRSLVQGPRNQPAADVPAAASAPEMRGVLVAAKDLSTGEFVQADSLRWQDWPDVQVPDTYLLRGAATEADMIGAVLRRHVGAGEPLAAASVVRPGERGFLAAVLEPGMRAISVPVDDAASNAGLVFPGDRIDVILTHLLEIQGDPGGPRRVSETVLRDVRVIAMGRSLKSEAAGGDALTAPARTATLETSPAEAEKVALANELGKLSLSLRSLAATGMDADRRASQVSRTWDQEVSPALRPENQPRSTLSLVRGDKAENVPVRRGAGT